MLISFQAFSWECKAKELLTDSFLQALTKHKQPIKYLNNRRLYVTDTGKYMNGLLLTIKDMRKFCTIQDDEGHIKLTAHELKKNEQVADFNFFVFDKTSSCGMYQHYYHSCSLPAFNVILKAIYSEILKFRKNKELEENPEKKEDKKFLAYLQKKYAGTMLWSIIERKDNFINRVKLLKELSAIEFEYSVLETEAKPYEPLYPYLKRAKHTMSFKTDEGASQAVATAAEWMSGQNFKKAKAFGLDANGNDVTYKLFNDFDKFATHDYDELVPSLSLDQSNIKDSINNNKIILALQQAYEDAALKHAAKP